MDINYIFDTNYGNIPEYWISHGLNNTDFYCRSCGSLMLDVDDLENVTYRPQNKHKCSRFKRLDKPYIESDTNRWLVIGRTLSGKTYHRHICWDCFFKQLETIEDIPRRARKSSWYKDINNGIFRPPAYWTSPSKYFKILFDISDKELEEEHKKFDTASLDSFIRRYGVDIGTNKYNEYKKRQAYTCSKEYMMNEKGMTETQWNDFNENRACTKKNFIKRYGDELGSQKWEEYRRLEAYVGCKLEYFTEKFGEEDGKKRYLELNKQKAQTLDNYIRIYGEKDGKIKYESITNKQYSNVSKTMFSIIQQRLGNFATGSMFGDHECPINIEFDDGSCRVCYPDYLLHAKIIEFNGDYWHGNPKFYKADDVFCFIDAKDSKYGGNTAECIWNYDKKKKEALEKLGYKVKVVWENDYHKDPEKIIEECIDFLKTK